MSYPDSGTPKVAEDELPFPRELIIDSHTHIGPWRDIYIPKNDAPGMLDHMSRLGIARVCTSAFAGIGADYVFGNDLVAQVVKDFPGKFIGFAVINPNYPEDMAGELERCRKMGLRGIKLYPDGHEYPPDGRNYSQAFEYADQHRCPVLSHSFGKPGCLDEIAGRYKNAVFIIGHGDDIWRDGSVGWESVVRKMDNVYVSLTTTYRYGEVERMVNEMGSDKLLFGTDIPYLDGGFQLGTVLYARVSYEDKLKILGLNMKRVLELLMK